MVDIARTTDRDMPNSSAFSCLWRDGARLTGAPSSHVSGSMANSASLYRKSRLLCPYLKSD